MNRIRDWLYIGKFRDTRDLTLLKMHNIGAMLQLAGNSEQPGIVTLYLPVEDGELLPPGKLEQGVAFVREQKAAGKQVLIACGAGISRSSTFVMAALMEEESLDMFDAYRIVYAHHTDALPHPELCQSLAEHYGVSLDGMAVWQRIFQIQRELK